MDFERSNTQKFKVLKKTYTSRIFNGEGYRIDFLQEVFHGQDAEAYELHAEDEHIRLISKGVEESLLTYPFMRASNQDR